MKVNASKTFSMFLFLKEIHTWIQSVAASLSVMLAGSTLVGAFSGCSAQCGDLTHIE